MPDNPWGGIDKRVETDPVDVPKILVNKQMDVVFDVIDEAKGGNRPWLYAQVSVHSSLWSKRQFPLF